MPFMLDDPHHPFDGGEPPSALDTLMAGGFLLAVLMLVKWLLS